MSLTEPMRLFTHPSSSASLRVKIYLSLAGVPSDLVEIVQTGRDTDTRGIPVYTLPKGDPVTDTLGTTDLKALNPEGRIPILLMPDGRKMTQSGAIIDVIRSHHSEDSLVPADPWAEAEMRRIMWIVAADVQPYQNIPFIIQAMTEWGMVSGVPTEHPLRTHFIRREFSAMEGILEGCAGRCAVGDDPTLADCFLVPQVRNALLAGIDLPSEFPLLNRVFEHCMDIPLIKVVIDDAGGRVQKFLYDAEKLRAVQGSN